MTSPPQSNDRSAHDPTAYEPPRHEPMIRIIAMPADTNPSGDIFGGWLISQMDLAAGNAAGRRSLGRCVTASVESMSFILPVKVGDEVSIYASVISVGRTSMRVSVEAWRRPLWTGPNQKASQAVFVFVALDELGRPRPVQ